jgi:hypothetical protein
MLAGDISSQLVFYLWAIISERMSCHNECYICYTCRCCRLNKPAVFKSVLVGCKEVPRNNSDAEGYLIGLLSADEQRFDFVLQTKGLVGITAAHFHDGPKGVNGPIVKNINIDLVTGNAVGSWTSTDLIQPLTPILVSKLKNKQIYVNVHTTAFPGGEIRDQVHPTRHVI